MVDRRYTDRVRVLKKLCNWGEIATLAQDRHARIGDPQSLNDLCWALLLLGHIAEFDAHFEKLAAIAGQSSSSGPQAILRLSAFRAYEARDYEIALKRFGQLAEIAKTDPGPRLKIADILLQLKRYDEAEQEIASLRRRLGQRDPRLQRLEERIRAKDRLAAQPAGNSAPPGQTKIVLFVPYFEPADPARRREIALCLERNLHCSAIDHIYLLIDDGAKVASDPARLTSLRLDHRPTYADWVGLSHELCPGQISVFANADIYFDNSIGELAQLFSADPNAFVALSRYDLTNGKETLHPNPHWSQDSWAFRPPAVANAARDACLDFPVGVPRCDNKVAYVFGVYGHTVYNPCRNIRSVHVHETGLRTYDKKGDLRIVGGMAMVHASETLLAPAKLDIEVWPIATAQFAKATVNGSLERWARQAATARSDIAATPGMIAYDAHWQFPAITEQHALKQMRVMGPRQAQMAYVGFPWATLIDLIRHNKSDHERRELLLSRLKEMANFASSYRRVVTVCQHIWMLEHLDIFRSVGVTDIFWSHATRDKPAVPGASPIELHPFPLYPVEIGETAIPFGERGHLFSFVGAKANGKYLTEVRNHIGKELSADPRGVVIERPAWHYNQIVYEGQILGRKAVEPNLIDGEAADEFRRIMERTKFTLCPSGTGPNSIRLWEAIASGSIPVVLSHAYRPPGSAQTWSQAIVACAKTRRAVRALPKRLEAIAANEAEVRRRLDALQLLAERYGRGNFVADVIDLMTTGERRRERPLAAEPAAKASRIAEREPKVDVVPFVPSDRAPAKGPVPQSHPAPVSPGTRRRSHVLAAAAR